MPPQNFQHILTRLSQFQPEEQFDGTAATHKIPNTFIQYQWLRIKSTKKRPWAQKQHTQKHNTQMRTQRQQRVAPPALRVAERAPRGAHRRKRRVAVAVRVHDGHELGEQRGERAMRVVGQLRGAFVSDEREREREGDIGLVRTQRAQTRQ